jgi:hypothetical protein
VASFAIDGKTGKLKHLGNGTLAHSIGLYRDRSQRQVPAQRVLSGAHGDGKIRSVRMDWAADIHLTPNGRFRYASERTTSTLSIFRVDAATGLITQIDTVLTAGAPEALVTNSNIKPITSALLRMVNTPDQR